MTPEVLSYVSTKYRRRIQWCRWIPLTVLASLLAVAGIHCLVALE
jgi:hypothetical protein